MNKCQLPHTTTLGSIQDIAQTTMARQFGHFLLRIVKVAFVDEQAHVLQLRKIWVRAARRRVGHVR